MTVLLFSPGNENRMQLQWHKKSLKSFLFHIVSAQGCHAERHLFHFYDSKMMAENVDVDKTYLQYCVLKLEAAFLILQIYLLALKLTSQY